MNRSILALGLLASAALASSASAQSAVVGGSSMPRPVPHADKLGPKLASGTVAESVARVQIEKDGYTGVRNLTRTSTNSWQGVALSQANKPVVVAVDRQGKVTEVR